MTTLTYRIAEALSRRWEPGDEIVVSRLDHDAKVADPAVLERTGCWPAWRSLPDRVR